MHVILLVTLEFGVEIKVVSLGVRTVRVGENLGIRIDLVWQVVDLWCLGVQACKDICKLVMYVTAGCECNSCLCMLQDNMYHSKPR